MKKKSVSDMTVEECIEKFLLLSFDPRICRVSEDYGKKNVKEHNKAIRKLNAFYDELDENIERAKNVYSELFAHEDVGIKFSSASACLKLNIHIERAVDILENIVDKNVAWYATWARRNLKLWRGEIGEYDANW
jgi:hypothetical protein